MDTQRIRENVAQGVLAQGERISAEQLDVVVAKLAGRLTPKDDALSYSFVTGRNWAISARRRRKALQRRELERMRTQRLQAEEEARRERLRAEFVKLSSKLTPLLRGAATNHLDILWKKSFLGYDEEQLASSFPGSSEVQRRQWASRGRKLLSQHASSDLLTFLGKR